MRKIELTAFELAQRFVGIKEVFGKVANPQILAMLQLDSKWSEDDSVPWCSAFINYIAWLLRLPRSKSLRARSWLNIGAPTHPDDAEVGFDVVILKRGKGDQPGPEVIDAPGHVGFFSGWGWTEEGEDHLIYLLGGNQSDSINISAYESSRVIGIRRLYE